MTGRTRLWLIGLACFGVLVGLVGPAKQQMVFDCGFNQEEFRFTFRDRDGKPVRGVQLRVETERGDDAFLFPVTDYIPNRIPVSDGKGVLTFHHVPVHGIEFSRLIHRWRFFAWEGDWVVDRDVPEYVCRFLLDGQEVHRAGYGDMANRSGWARTTCLWEWPDWPASEYVRDLQEGQDDWNARRLRLFDADKDGKLDTGEGIAARTADSVVDKTFAAWRDPKKRREELTFGVIERVVTLP